jgi:hypothetical protein
MELETPVTTDWLTEDVQFHLCDLARLRATYVLYALSGKHSQQPTACSSRAVSHHASAQPPLRVQLYIMDSETTCVVIMSAYAPNQPSQRQWVSTCHR